MGPATGRPTPWSADSVVASLYLTRCTGSPWHSLCPSSTSHTPCSSFPSLVALVSLQVHKKKKKNIPFLCILICISFAFRVYILLFARMFCGGTTAPQERFCGASSPTRTILWSVVTHKNNFVRGNHAPQGLLTLWTADLVFTNSHIISPSVWFVCLLQCLSGTSEGRCREHSRR